MIKIEKEKTYGWEEAIRGMRNPMNSWDRSDSRFDLDCDRLACRDCPEYGDCNPEHFDTYKTYIGPNDHDLMMRLAKCGRADAKYRRMITVYVDITAPLYWWKEFDTYKVGTVANSCSTMHKIHAKEFTLDDFSHDHLYSTMGESYEAMDCLANVIECLNKYRNLYSEANEKLKNRDLTGAERKHVAAQQKHWWWQMIQLLPSSYNQKRTVMLNYEVLNNMYHSRKNHKLDEWRDFCAWIKTLPYSELITGEVKNDESKTSV